MLPFRYDPGRLGSVDVEIAITHCGICHSDLHLISNDWGISQYPFIPGHEIVGTVTAVGSRVRALKTGTRVGLGWQSNSCGPLRVVHPRNGESVSQYRGHVRAPQRRLC